MYKLLISLAFLGCAASVSYKGYKVYKVFAKTELENEYLLSLEHNKNFDFWSRINKVGNPVTVMVSPEAQSEFVHVLMTNKIQFNELINDVESTIQKENQYYQLRQLSTKLGSISFDQYYTHKQINAYLEQLAVNYSGTVNVESIGTSYEGRSMNLVRISSGSSNPPKPVIFVDAGIHAREWIAPAVALYLINQLVENSTNSDLVRDVDWIILPSANPDGYEYSWTTDRMWRKTRSPGAYCDGCDPNRNFDFHWMESGSSSYECSEIYAGKSAFSEVETQNLRDLLLGTNNIQAYITLHSYGQYLMYPWAYDSIKCDNWKELDDLGNKMADAIKAVAGTSYKVGNVAMAVYAAAGGSDDYAMGVGNISIVYTMELPEGGSSGFNPPPSTILPVSIETFEGFKVLADYVGNNKK